MKLGTFTLESCSENKKCTKERDARAKLLFCQSKPIAFSPFSLPSPSLLLKLPNVNSRLGRQHRRAPLVAAISSCKTTVACDMIDG